MIEVIEVVAIIVSLGAIVSDWLYFKLRFPQCTNCGWLTKKNGRCCGCHASRIRKWE